MSDLCVRQNFVAGLALTTHYHVRIFAHRAVNQTRLTGSLSRQSLCFPLLAVVLCTSNHVPTTDVAMLRQCGYCIIGYIGGVDTHSLDMSKPDL